MIAIVCLDDHNGMLFNKRRQSRDSMVINDIATMTKKGELFCNAYSAKLFAADAACTVRDEDLMTPWKEGTYFYENVLPDSLKYFHEILCYRWNRKYPGDMFFHFDLAENGFQMMDRMEFEGSSHKKITKEIWRRVL